MLGCRIAGAFSFREPGKRTLLREDMRPALGIVVALPCRVGAESYVEERSRPGLREAEALAVHRELSGEAHRLIPSDSSSSAKVALSDSSQTGSPLVSATRTSPS